MSFNPVEEFGVPVGIRVVNEEEMIHTASLHFLRALVDESMNLFSKSWRQQASLSLQILGHRNPYIFQHIPESGVPLLYLHKLHHNAKQRQESIERNRMIVLSKCVRHVF